MCDLTLHLLYLEGFMVQSNDHRYCMLRTLSLNTLLSKLNAFALFFVKWISYKALYSSCLHSPFPYILARPAKIVSNDIFPLCCTLTGLATLCMIMTNQNPISLHVRKPFSYFWHFITCLSQENLVHFGISRCGGCTCYELVEITFMPLILIELEINFVPLPVLVFKLLRAILVIKCIQP